MVTTADTEDAVPIAPWTLMLYLVLFFFEAVVTHFRRSFRGTATTRVSTLTPSEAVPALPALSPWSPPLAASRVLLVPSVGRAMGGRNATCSAGGTVGGDDALAC